MDIKQSFEGGMVALSIIIILVFEIYTRDKYNKALASIGGVGFASFIIVMACLSYKYYYNKDSNILTAIIIIVLLSTYVQLLISTQKNADDKCENNTDLNWFTKSVVYNDNISEDKGKERLWYTVFYVIMLTIILLTILNMYDSNSESVEKVFKPKIDLLGFIKDKKKYLPYIIYAFPLILPLITELINLAFDVSNESIFTSFILGSTPEKFKWKDNGLHAVLTSIVVLLFIWYILSHSGLIPNWFLTPLTETAIRLILILLILFPLVMNYIFMQNCSIEEIKGDENNDKDEFSCEISKYGGILFLVILTLIISFIHSLKVTEIKSFYLFIIISSSIAGGFILNVIKPLTDS